MVKARDSNWVTFPPRGLEQSRKNSAISWALPALVQILLVSNYFFSSSLFFRFCLAATADGFSGETKRAYKDERDEKKRKREMEAAAATERRRRRKRGGLCYVEVQRVT